MSRTPTSDLKLAFSVALAGLACCASLGAPHGLHRLAGTPGVGRSQNGGGLQPAAQVTLELIKTQRDGRTAAGPHFIVPLELNGSAVRYLGVGRANGTEPCVLNSYWTQPSDLPWSFWQADVRLVAATASQTTVELRWSRTRGDRVEAGDTRVVTLLPDQYHLVDYVAPPDAASPCANVALQVRANPVPDDSTTPLNIDVWLVQDGAGERRLAHQQVSGRSGGSATAFNLEPLEFSPQGGPLAERRPASQTVGLQVRGTVRAALRRDGFVDVSIEATRRLSFANGQVEGNGQQDFRNRPGETAEIMLPPAAGHVAALDFARFFQGATTSLFVTVTRRP